MQRVFEIARETEREKEVRSRTNMECERTEIFAHRIETSGLSYQGSTYNRIFESIVIQKPVL